MDKLIKPRAPQYPDFQAHSRAGAELQFALTLQLIMFKGAHFPHSTFSTPVQSTHHRACWSPQRRISFFPLLRETQVILNRPPPR